MMGGLISYFIAERGLDARPTKTSFRARPSLGLSLQREAKAAAAEMEPQYLIRYVMPCQAFRTYP